MKISSSLIVVICTIALFSTVYGTTNEECQKNSNTDCKTCLAISDCAYCKSTKACFRYSTIDYLSNNCSTPDTQLHTCVGNFQVWIIIVSVLAGIILIAALIVTWCLCRKCKKRRIRKEERRQERDDQRMEERRAAAEVRTADRNRVADQIRMKYGILKANEPGTDYTRME